MLLTFDIGNTQIKMGVFDKETLVGSWRMTTTAQRTSDEFGVNIVEILRRNNIAVGQIDKILVSSVVPGIMHSFLNAIEHYVGIEPIIVNVDMNTRVRVATKYPHDLGADLLTDAEAAYTLYGGPTVVVDFGTATKYIVINEKGELIAVVISPGIGISLDALVARAAQLPTVAIAKPDTILTNDTVPCIQAGLVYGTIGSVEYIVNKIKDELCANNPALKPEDITTVATGGFGRVIALETKCIQKYDPMLTLSGLRLLADQN